MAPSAAATSASNAETAAPSSNGVEKPTDSSAAPAANGLQPENPNEPTPTPVVPQPAVTKTDAPDALAATNGGAAEVPKPVSVEEIRDQDLPDAKPLEAVKASEDAPKPDVAAPEADKEATTGSKRKADDTADSQAVGAKDEEKPAEKKAKTNGAAADDAATNGAARKPGRPKKDAAQKAGSKKAAAAAAPVGRTARKTRSQTLTEPA